jgi:hypothetical protein
VENAATNIFVAAAGREQALTTTTAFLLTRVAY